VPPADHAALGLFLALLRPLLRRVLEQDEHEGVEGLGGTAELQQLLRVAIRWASIAAADLLATRDRVLLPGLRARIRS
jgi:hypothetical protein